MPAGFNDSCLFGLEMLCRTNRFNICRFYAAWSHECFKHPSGYKSVNLHFLFGHISGTDTCNDDGMMYIGFFCVYYVAGQTGYVNTSSSFSGREQLP